MTGSEQKHSDKEKDRRSRSDPKLILIKHLSEFDEEVQQKLILEMIKKFPKIVKTFSYDQIRLEFKDLEYWELNELEAIIKNYAQE